MTLRCTGSHSTRAWILRRVRVVVGTSPNIARVGWFGS